MTTAPTPSPAARLDLFGYLQQLTHHVGYRICSDALDQACANDPSLIIDWVLSAAYHAGLAHARTLLTDPAEQLRDFIATGSFESSRTDVAKLHGLYWHDERLQTYLAKATEDFANRCAWLVEAGLTTPASPAPHEDRQPPAVSHPAESNDAGAGWFTTGYQSRTTAE